MQADFKLFLFKFDEIKAKQKDTFTVAFVKTVRKTISAPIAKPGGLDAAIPRVCTKNPVIFADLYL